MCVISILLNGILFLYARTVVSKLLKLADELYDLGNMIDNFTQHIESVYELETFYGDDTLNSLMEHARSFNSQMYTFENIYTLVDDENEEQIAENDTEMDNEI